jgi:hypothetical protein
MQDEDDLINDEYYGNYDEPKINFPVYQNYEIVKLPEELENEPYTIKDNGFKPEIRIKSKTLFHIIFEEDVILLWVGNQDYFMQTDYRAILPQKSSTKISVVDIYENYGLYIVHSFLKYLYSHPISRRNPLWLVMYLQGSILTIQPTFPVLDDITDGYILYLSSFLFSNFIIMESSMPKLTNLKKIEGSEPPVPPEILAKIFQSTRLSKELHNITLFNKCVKDPVTLDELSFTEGGIQTFYLSGIYFCEWDDEVGNFHISILDTNTPVSLYHLSGIEAENKHQLLMDEVETDVQITGYSLSSYKRAYENRDCPVKKSIISLLDNLSKDEVNAENYTQTCTWIVQLSVDTQYLTDNIFETYNDLELKLKKLIMIAIDMVNDDKL